MEQLAMVWMMLMTYICGPGQELLLVLQMYVAEILMYCICFILFKPDLLLHPLQTVHEGRIYQLKLFCDTDYPDKPPTVQFQSRINMTCVNQETGLVLMHSFSSVSTFEAVYE
jgi:hypothetical protein